MNPIKQRSIPMCVILSLVTCGIYGLYWYVCMNDEINQVSNHLDDSSGIKCLLFTIITCGLYSFYWAYKTGNKVDEIKTLQGQTSSNTGIIYLVLSILGLGIVAWVLIQDALNKCAAA